MRPLSQSLRRLFTREIRPAGDRANADLVHEMMLELEDPQPSSLLLNIATGFPSALLCVLSAGVLAGALAGREVSAPSAPAFVAQAVPATPVPSARAPAQSITSVLAGRHAQLQEMELQAMFNAPPLERTATADSTSRR